MAPRPSALAGVWFDKIGQGGAELDWRRPQRSKLFPRPRQPVQLHVPRLRHSASFPSEWLQLVLHHQRQVVARGAQRAAEVRNAIAVASNERLDLALRAVARIDPR